MYQVFSEAQQDAKHLPSNSNHINYSLFKEFECKLPFRSFSIKYVVEGCEKYTINGNRFHVTDGQYLLANQFSEGTVHIESKKTVRGICIDLSMNILSEVVASHQRPDTPIADLALDHFFSSADFLENQYTAARTNTGKLLLGLGSILSRNPFLAHEFTSEFYYQLAEGLVQDHQPIYQQIKAVSSIRMATKKELVRKVNHGKEFMDAYFCQSLEIADIAKESGLSEYHFYRLFKSVFGVSPYQYILHKRLDAALDSIKSGHSSLTDIALATGFSDIHAFSKSFKKRFGVAPSGWVE